MGIVEVVLIGVALSMDAFAVTISDMFAYPAMTRARQLMLPVAFGLFQGLMPVLGYVLGSAFGSVIERYSGIVALIILGFIGGNMIKEGVQALRGTGDGEADVESGVITLPAVVMQAIATSIDAFAVGVTLRAEAASIVSAASIIALTTFALCIVALVVGRRFGTVLGERAEVVGGIVLVIIGIKAMLP